MNIYKLCDYFEDIGIINLDTISTFLHIYTRLQNSTKAIIPNNVMRAKYALYNFIKHIASDNTLLLVYSKQILEKYSTYSTLQQQANLRGMVQIIHFKLKLSAMASFYKLRNFKEENKKKKKHNEFSFNQSNFIHNNIGINPNRKSPQGDKKIHINATKVTINNMPSNKNQIKKTISFKLNSHNDSTSTHKYHKSLTLNQKESYDRDNYQRKNSDTNKNYNKPNKNNNKTALSRASNSLKSKDNNHHSHRNQPTLDQFYSNQAQYISDHKDKLYALRLEKQKQMESIFTFHPLINQQQHLQPQYPFSKTQSLTIDSKKRIPRYIKLNQDAVKHKAKISQLEIKLKEEEENERRSHSYKTNFNTSNVSDIPSAFYYEKLYRDAYDFKQRKKVNEKNYWANITFQPHSEFTNSRLEIKTTFNERNQRSIENKRRYQAMKEDEERNSQLKKRKDRLSKEQIEENNRSVIERLYIKHFDKEREKENRSKEKSLSSSYNNQNQHHHDQSKANTLSIVSSDNSTPLLSTKLKHDFKKQFNTGDNNNNKNASKKGDCKINIDPSLSNSKVLIDIISNNSP